MSKKDFSFYYNINTKTGEMIVDKKYIPLSAKSTAINKTKPESSFKTSSSGGIGYGINLI